MGKKLRVVVGLSGGVDSAVSAWLLKQQGHEVVGIFMKNWEDDDDSEYCSSNVDFVDAAAVADVIGIEIEHVNFAADYKDRVFAEFLREYQAGRTPNPDILCNAEIKFKAFLDHAMRLGAEKIATGHYARVRLNPRTGRHELLKGLDPSKDQSYFLHRLNQAQLSKTLFPVGELHKTEVRRIAAEIGLPNAKKKDSTGICFIGERPFREFLNRYISREPGPIKDENGRTIGQHVGQRRGARRHELLAGLDAHTRRDTEQQGGEDGMGLGRVARQHAIDSGEQGLERKGQVDAPLAVGADREQFIEQRAADRRQVAAGLAGGDHPGRGWAAVSGGDHARPRPASQGDQAGEDGAAQSHDRCP